MTDDGWAGERERVSIEGGQSGAVKEVDGLPLLERAEDLMSAARTVEVREGAGWRVLGGRGRVLVPNLTVREDRRIITAGVESSR